MDGEEDEFDFDEAPEVDALEQHQQEVPEGQVEPKQGEQQPLTAEAIASAVTAAVQQNQPQQQQAPMSQEEIAKVMKVWSPSEDFTKQFAAAFGEEGIDANAMQKVFLDMRDGLMGQATTYAQLMSEKLRQEMLETIQPLQQHFSEAQKRAGQERFFGQYPQLKKYEKIVPQVAAQLKAQGFQADEQTTFDTIAQGVEKFIQNLGVEFSLGQKRQATNGGNPPNVMTNSTPKGSTKVQTGDVGSVWD